MMIVVQLLASSVNYCYTTLPKSSGLTTFDYSLSLSKTGGPQIIKMETDRQKPIAIVGMSFRFPGDATTPDGFWDILREKVNVPPLFGTRTSLAKG